ncbi:MAG: hypothetical protein NVS4B8_11760 [Herpetosiphon sp.]
MLINAPETTGKVAGGLGLAEAAHAAWVDLLGEVAQGFQHPLVEGPAQQHGKIRVRGRLTGQRSRKEWRHHG